MKRTILIAILFVGLNSCDKTPKKQSPKPIEAQWGKDSAFAIINGAGLTFNSIDLRTIHDSLLYLSFYVQKQNSAGGRYTDENLLLKMVRKNTNVQRLDSFGFVSTSIITPPDAFFFTTTDEDVLNETFVIYRPDSLNNWIQITEQKNDYKKIRGRFSVALIKADSGIKFKYPDTIIIRDGVFNISTE